MSLLMVLTIGLAEGWIKSISAAPPILIVIACKIALRSRFESFHYFIPTDAEIAACTAHHNDDRKHRLAKRFGSVCLSCTRELIAQPSEVSRDVPSCVPCSATASNGPELAQPLGRLADVAQSSRAVVHAAHPRLGATSAAAGVQRPGREVGPRLGRGAAPLRRRVPRGLDDATGAHPGHSRLASGSGG